MYQDSFPILQKFIKAYDGDAPPKHLIFGDSVALRVASDDADQRSLEKMVSSRLGEENVCYISTSAFNAHVFSLFCNALSKTRHKPSNVIVPINLRSFSSSWNLNPQYQFLWETATIDDFAKDITAPRELIAPTPIADSIYRAIPVNFFARETQTIGDYLDVIAQAIGPGSTKKWNNRLRDIFTFHYCEKMHPKNRKLQSLGFIVKTLGRMNISVGFYFTPINYCAGRKYVGRAFRQRITYNIKFVEKYLSEYKVKALEKEQLSKYANKSYSAVVVNDVFDCDETDFFTPHNATEHVRCDARQRLAILIDDIIKTI